ncbi:MAG: methyltransferase domain-containing protein, partial [Rhizobacter sp.]
MKKWLDRLSDRMQKVPAFDLEMIMRGFLIRYFLHTSQSSAVEIVGEGRKALCVYTPTVFKGNGRIRVSNNTYFGEPVSPGNYDCSYIDARSATSFIEIGAETAMNNKVTLISEGAGIHIGARCLIGPELQVFDSNMHQMPVSKRSEPDDKPRAVRIGDDVFIGARVTILKGAQIGNGCVIAAGTVVTPGFVAPAGSIVGGNPCAIVGSVPDERAKPEQAPPNPQPVPAAAPAPTPAPMTSRNPQDIPVVAVSYNSPELLFGLVSSFRKFYPHNPIHIVDGSEAAHLAKIREVVAGFEGVHLHAMEYNIHHGPGMAWAIQNLNLSGPVLFLDTDILVVREGFIEEMLAALQPDDYGVGGVAYVNRDGFDIEYAYGAVPYLHPPCMLCNVEVMRQYPMPVKHGAPMVAPMLALHDANRSELVRNIDWCMNDVRMGTEKVYIDHFGKGTSSRTGGYHLEEWMAEMVQKRERQGAEMAMRASYNPDLLNLMPAGRKVLEVGCSTGGLAQAYQEKNGQADYWGIEFDAKAADMAKRHCSQVTALDVESMSDKELAELSTRNCWVFGDVLEHLRDPWRLLARIRKVLPADGCVVVSLPNAQHWSVQAKLAIGDFRYTAGGLMDRTHLRWFTRVTLLELFKNAGFRIEAGGPRIFEEPARERALPAIRLMAESL